MEVKHMRTFLEVIMTRRSIRDFKEGNIPPEDVERILQAGIMAPSPGNSQPWRFHVIRGKTKEKFVEVLKNIKTIPPLWHQLVVRSMGIVPVVIAVENPIFTNKDDSSSSNAFKVCGETKLKTTFINKDDITSLGSLLGTAASVENMLLAAHSLGYGSVWLAFPPILEAVKEIIEIHGEIVGVLPVGHPADHQKEYVNRSRKPMEEVTKFYD
ncbi:MAG: nitroreductase family protein [Candidatus Aminicenantia bacterium]